MENQLSKHKLLFDKRKYNGKKVVNCLEILLKGNKEHERSFVKKTIIIQVEEKKEIRLTYPRPECRRKNIYVVKHGRKKKKNLRKHLRNNNITRSYGI